MTSASPAIPSARLGVMEKLAYGLGDTASNFFFQAFNQFLVFYYIDIFGLNAGPVGTLMLVAPIAVAVLNPVIGVVADRTQSRWGKFRPYLLWGAVPYGLLGYIMFLNPTLDAAGKLIFAAVTYTLMLVAYAAINTPYSALMGVMTPSSSERTSLSTYRFACAFSGAAVIGWAVPWLKNQLGGASPAEGFRNTMAVFAVVSVVMFLFTFWRTKERVQPPAEQRASLSLDLRVLRGNGPWLVLFFAAFLTLANVGVRSGSAIFYFKYCLTDESLLPNFNLFGSLAFIAGTFSTKLFLRFFSRRGLMIGLTILNALAMGTFFFVEPSQHALLHGLNIFAAFVAGPTPAIVWSMYADTADFGEWKFRRRTTGLIFSAAVFAQKVGLAVGSALLAWSLGLFGFVENAVQTPEAVFGIRVLFSLVPAVFALLSGFAIFFYRLDEPTVKQVEAELAARRENAPTPQTVAA